MRFPSVTLRLPGWVDGLILDPDRTYPNAEDRTRLAVELSREGSHRGKGDLSEQRSSTGRRTSSSPPVPRPRCKPRSCPGLLLRPREDGGDHGYPPARWGLRPGRGGAATLRAGRQYRALLHVLWDGPLVRCKAPRPRRPRRGRRSGRLRQRTEARRVGAYARRTRHHRGARRAP